MKLSSEALIFIAIIIALGVGLFMHKAEPGSTNSMPGYTADYENSAVAGVPVREVIHIDISGGDDAQYIVDFKTRRILYKKFPNWDEKTKINPPIGKNFDHKLNRHYVEVPAYINIKKHTDTSVRLHIPKLEELPQVELQSYIPLLMLSREDETGKILHTASHPDIEDHLEAQKRSIEQRQKNLPEEISAPVP